jgi:hypothetical protein
MRNIKYFLPGLILLLIAGACNDYLDVRPENKIILENLWKKESDVEAVLLACYRAMQENDYKDHETDGFMDRVIVWGELRSDNVIAGGGAADAERQVNNVNILPTNYNCSWASFYKVINYCNTVLKYAPDVLERDPNFTESDMQVKKAEALGIRALCYFYLVRTFRDVPWIEEATVSDDQPLDVAQSAPEVVFGKITDDLLQAEVWALSEYSTVKETKGRMTKDVIRAILADVYLWRKNYTKCVEYCDKLINARIIIDNFSGKQEEVQKYELLEEKISSKIFNEGNSSESIFELQFSSEKNNDAVTNFYGNSNSVGQITANTSYADGTNVFSSTDDRKADFIVFPKTQSGDYKIFKYLGSHTSFGNQNNYSFRETTANWIFYRITDIMLMKAEALVQLNRSEDDLRNALHIVNRTYMRANPTLLESDSLTVSSFTDPAPLEKLVLLERQRELMFEGKRWFDLVRHSERKNSTEDLVSHVMNKYTNNISTIRSKLGVMNALYFPIHADELKVNKLLKQNPYYETSTTIEKN